MKNGPASRTGVRVYEHELDIRLQKNIYICKEDLPYIAR